MSAQNQAGPSSAPPETQQGLKEKQQTPEEIITGARQEDQLDAMKQNAANPAPDSATPEDTNQG